MLKALTQPAKRTVVPSLVSAVSRFGGFKPDAEGPQPVRSPQAAVDELQRLRNLREMLRFTPPEVVMGMLEINSGLIIEDGLNIFEAVALAKREGKLMAPNSVIGRVLNETKYYPPTIRTGTMVIYEKPNQPFTEEVRFGGIEFSVPEQFRGKKNCALVVEHPDFDLLSLENDRYQLIVPDESKLHLLRKFPEANNLHYLPDGEFGIPCGDPMWSLKTRQIRRDNIAYTGPAARGVFNSRREVDLYDRPSVGLEVALI